MDSRVQHQQGIDRRTAHLTNPGSAEDLPNIPPEGDIEMQPAPTNNSKHPEPPETHHQAAAGEHCDDVPMECVATALDPVDDDTHSSDKESRQLVNTLHGHSPVASNSNLAKANLDQNHHREPGQNTQDGITSSPSSPKVKHLHQNAGMPADHEDVANVGYSRLCDTSQPTAQAHFVPNATVQPSLMDCPTQRKDATHRPTHTHSMPQAAKSLKPPAYIANDPTPKQQDHSDNLTLQVGLPAHKSQQISKQTSRSKDEHRGTPNQPPETILDLLAQNAAYQPLDDNAKTHAPSDDVIFVKASHSPIDNILCGSEQSSNLLISNREIITGRPSSIFPMLTAITLPSLQRVISLISQATCAMRLLHFVSSPMHLGMITCFHGHIRELVLCAIGNGWTWADQTATVQGRRSERWRGLRCFCQLPERECLSARASL